MLETQKFLLTKTPAILETELGIKGKPHPKYPNLIHFSYDQIESPKDHPIVHECRGLILDADDNWKVIAYPFRRFPNYGETWGGALDWNTLRVQEKVDGCHPYGALVNLWGGGTMKIGEIVKNRLIVDLIGQDEHGNLVKTQPTHWFNNGKKHNWIQIKTERLGKSRGTLKVTPNHELFVNGDYKFANDIAVGDVMLRYADAPAPSVLHLIRSSLLGDGSITLCDEKTAKFSSSHKVEHEEYNKCIENWLGAFAVKSRPLTSGYGTVMTQVCSVTTPALKKLRDEWYPNSRRKLPLDLSWIDAFSLAMLYMDNGSLSHSDEQQDRAIISCNWMSKEDTQRLATKIIELCGVDAVVFESKGFNIRINASPHDTPIASFWKLITPYVVGCMRYKLPPEFLNSLYYEYPSGEQSYDAFPVQVLSVDRIEATTKTFPSGSVGYDIETTTHNYMAHGLLGHNSLMILWHYKGEWNVSTKGSPDAGGTVGDYNFTFSDLFWKTLVEHMSFGYSGAFEEHCTYMIELTSIYNRVVCSYGKETQLTLIGARDISKDGYPEIRVSLFETGNLTTNILPVVKEYPLNSVEDIIKAAEALNPIQNEGFVVVDSKFKRTKIKSPSYVMIHHLKEGMSQRRIIRLIQLGEQSEILAYFPEYQEMFDDIQVRIDAKLAEVEADFHRIKHLTDRKEFALEATKTSCPDVLFGLFTGQGTSVRDYVLYSKKVIKKATATEPAMEHFRYSEDKIERMIGLKSKELLNLS